MLIKAVTPVSLVLNSVFMYFYLFISLFLFHILPQEADLAGTLPVTITNHEAESVPQVIPAVSEPFFLLMKVREEAPFLFLGDNSSLSPVICAWPL